MFYDLTIKSIIVTIVTFSSFIGVAQHSNLNYDFYFDASNPRGFEEPILKKGERFKITADGIITANYFQQSNSWSSTPEGCLSKDTDFIYPQLPSWSLLGQIGNGKVFLVGSSYSGVAEESGILKLFMNYRTSLGYGLPGNGHWIVRLRSDDNCLQQAAMIANWHPVKQVQGNWCWAAVAEMMIENANNGTVISQCKFAKQKLKTLGKDLPCCDNGGDNNYSMNKPTPCDIAATLNEAFDYAKYSFTQLLVLPPSVIKEEISCNHHPIAYMMSQWSGNIFGYWYVNHYRIIHGYNDNGILFTLTVYDPALNADIQMTYIQYFYQCSFTYYNLSKKE